MHRFVRVCRLAAFLALALSCRDSTGPKTVTQAKALWDSQGISSYVYSGTIRCFCVIPEGPVQVTVANGRVVDVTDPVSGVKYSTTGWPTVDELFAMIQTRAPDQLEFNEQLGYPTLVEFCCLANDSGVRYRVESLRPIVTLN